MNGPESSKTYVIAEMASSHEGNPDLARKIIDGAGRAGADAIQFQVWVLRNMMVPHHPDFERVSKIELSQDRWMDLANYVHQKYPGMQIIACVYERESVDFCVRAGVDAFKLHTADLSNPFLITHVAQTGKRIDLSIGASTIDEIQTAVEWIRDTSSSEIWLMYGYQNFPTPTDAIHLNYMLKLKGLFGLRLGYQDHSDGGSESAFWLPAAALGMGIDVLEKHITHDRSYKGIDHEAALNPDEFLRFMQMIRVIEDAKGLSAPHPFTPDELKYRKYSKKSLVASHDLAAGTQITEADLTFMRADTLGLPPDQAGRLVGRAAKQNIKAYQLVREDDVL